MRRALFVTTAVGFIVSILIAATTSQIVKAGSVVVQTISNNHPVLTVGGPSVTVRVTGQNLNIATGGVALLNGTAVNDIVVTLGPAGSTSRDVTLSANSALIKSVSGYRLRIIAGMQTIDVPPDICVIDVVYSMRTVQGTVAVRPPVPSASVPPPNVDTTRLPLGGRTGWGIVFWGRDFIPDRFVAMVGSTLLNITYRSTTEIHADLPSQRMTAPLTVSHGTENSRIQLRPSFEVYAPAITSVVPLNFSRGSWVDIVGWDLDHARPVTYTTTPSGLSWVMIEDNPDGVGRDTLIRADSWSVAPEGRSARFKAVDPYDPQVTTLRGKLRLVDNDTGSFDVASPMTVNWNLGLPLIITAVHPGLQWNGRNVDFILLQQGTQNVLVAEGYGIKPETRAKMGTLDLSTISCSGTQGMFNVPYQASTNTVQFTCGSATVQFPTSIKVGVWPRLDPSSYTTQNSIMMIVLNREYTLRGWGLKPSIPGLVISLDFVFVTPGLPVQLQILEQTDNLIRFKIATTGPLPSNYMEYREFNSYWQFHLYGRYQGGTLFSFLAEEYRLIAQ